MENGLANIYRGYIDCLNSRTLENLHQFVAADVVRNSQQIGLPGYIEMLQQNFEDIPDLTFQISLLVCEDSYIASRLSFDCTPKGVFLGVPVNGRRVVFTENVFYLFKDEKIQEVWSVIDKVAIEEQLEVGR